MNDHLKELLAEAVRDADLRCAEIPAIDLYLDQILCLFSDAQSRGAAQFAERQLTRTMINNYSKDGLIMPVKGKKYSKEHIVQMLLIYSLKNTLSMTEIKRILSDAYDKGLPLAECYDAFVEAKADDRELCLAALDAVISRHEYDMTKDADYMGVVLELCAMSDYLRCMAQALLDDRYPDRTAEEKAPKKPPKEKPPKPQKEKPPKEKAPKKNADAAATENAPSARGAEPTRGEESV